MTVTEKSLFKARDNFYRFVMQQTGFKIDENVEFRTTKLQFLRYYKQISPFINGRQYNIIESNKIAEFFANLKIKNKNLSLEYDIRLRYLFLSLQLGKEIITYCSNNYLDSTKIDPLWLSWDIYHFHFTQKSDGRTDYLIFAMIKDNDIYIIDIKPHGEWENLDLLYTIDKNWPDLLVKVSTEIQGRQLTSEEIKILRKEGINTTLYLSNGSAIMQKNLVTIGNIHISTFMEMVLEQDYIENIKLSIQKYNFETFTPQFIHILNIKTWVVILLNKELNDAIFCYDGNLNLITQELVNFGIIKNLSKKNEVTDIAIALLNQPLKIENF